jgi:hypothetical protein
MRAAMRPITVPAKRRITTQTQAGVLFPVSAVVVVVGGATVTTVVDVFTVRVGFVCVSVVVVAVMTGLVSVTEVVCVTVAATRVCVGSVGAASTVSVLVVGLAGPVSVRVVRFASVPLRVPLAAVPPPPHAARRTAERNPISASRATNAARVQRRTIDSGDDRFRPEWRHHPLWAIGARRSQEGQIEV